MLDGFSRNYLFTLTEDATLTANVAPPVGRSATLYLAHAALKDLPGGFIMSGYGGDLTAELEAGTYNLEVSVRAQSANLPLPFTLRLELDRRTTPPPPPPQNPVTDCADLDATAVAHSRVVVRRRHLVKG